MNFYTGVHPFYCGVDLHARSMYLCILDSTGQTRFHRNIRSEPEAFLQAVAPFREGLIVAVECVFCWYWLADLCREQGIDFVLGHALYMKAVHGGKTKNDRPWALTRSPRSYAEATFPWPTPIRPSGVPHATCSAALSHLMHKRAELLAHIQNTATQYNLPSLGKKIAYKANRENVADHFPNPEVLWEHRSRPGAA